MSTELEIPTELIEEKLRDLRRYLPDEELDYTVCYRESLLDKMPSRFERVTGDEIFYEFARYIADRLWRPNTTPENFKWTAEKICDQMMHGGHAYYSSNPDSEFPTHDNGSELPRIYPKIGLYLLRRINDIADAVCPPEFAEEIKKYKRIGIFEKGRKMFVPLSFEDIETY